MASHWDAFEPELAAALKNVFDQEFGQLTQPYLDQIQAAEADRQLAAVEDRMRATYPDYDRNRVAIIQHAVDNGIGNLEVAYKAWRGPQGPAEADVRPDEPADSHDLAQETDTSKARRERDAALRDRGDYIKTSTERQQLKWAQDAENDEKLAAYARSAKGDDDRKETLAEINRERERFNRENTERASRGKTPQRRPKNREEMDLKVLDMLHGGPLPKEPRRQSRNEAQQDALGMTKDERKFAAAIRAGNVGAVGQPPTSTPNAETIVSGVAGDGEQRWITPTTAIRSSPDSAASPQCNAFLTAPAFRGRRSAGSPRLDHPSSRLRRWRPRSSAVPRSRHGRGRPTSRTNSRPSTLLDRSDEPVHLCPPRECVSELAPQRRGRAPLCNRSLHHTARLARARKELRCPLGIPNKTSPTTRTLVKPRWQRCRGP